LKKDLFEESGPDLLLADNITSGFLMLVLLTRCNEGGINYSPRTNYRLSSVEKMNVKNNLGRTMSEYAMSADSSEEFSSSKLALMFYKIAKITKFWKDTPRLTSIATEKIKLGNETISNCEVHIGQTQATYVQEEDFLKLCCLLNVHPDKMTKDCREKGLFDFEAILNRKESTAIRTRKDLHEFVKKVLDWPFFELNQRSFAHNVWRIRSFLQTMTGVGISMLEGSHRITIAAKLLTAMNLDESLPFMAHQHKQETRLPKSSPIWASLSVQVLTDKTRAHASKENPHHVMLEETMRCCRRFSEGVAEKKTHYIDSTWRDWIGQVLLEIRQSSHIDQRFNAKSFIKVPNGNAPSSDDPYLPNHVGVAKIVAQCLFEKLPSKRLVAKALTAPVNKKHKAEVVTQKDFTSGIIYNKSAKYQHEYWNAVSKKI
jgi:hypothetical protein